LLQNSPVASSPKLSIRDVTRIFGKGEEVRPAISHISLDVYPGETAMLVGPSGCGKSTLLNIIAGLDRATQGSVQLDGKEVFGPGPDRTLVFQDGALFPWLTALGNVEFGLRQIGVNPRERRQRAMRYLFLVNLEGFENYCIHQLSGGMRQRVAIARSLALEPQVLLLDEPFSALDALTREDLYGEVQELSAKLGTTIVFVTHNVREAATLGDRVFLLAANPGRLQAEFEISCPRPRHIDDLDVIQNAHKISEALKEGRRPLAEVSSA
jgi:NitT/TauT family transport system ATP-binding protein